MERPSHIIFDHHQPFTRRMTFVVLAIGLQLGGFWLFTHGLASHVSTMIHPFTFVATYEKQVPPAKPPEPKITAKVDIPVVTQPVFTMAQPSKGDGGITTTLPQGSDAGGAVPRENIVHAAVGILSTHTVPPYPPIARRIGAEGKVTLRLTVSVEGRVTQADVETSSGRDELDQTARQWIMAHWAYKPATEKGVPVVSHVMAMVTFSLAAER